MRNSVISSIEENRIIVIVRGVERDKLIPLAEAMYEGGIRLLELTFSADGSTSDASTAESIRILTEHFRDRMIIGAGTVLTEHQVELVASAGGKFIISPDINPAVIKKTRELELVSMPGAITPTEIQTAHVAGADFVKLFPVSSFGADYVKAVKAPLSQVKLLAVGGIHDGNMKEYAKAGVLGFGIGSNITDKKLIEAGEYKRLAELAKRYAVAAKEAFL